MNEISLTIDGKKMTVPEGQKILWAALENGIYIPNLCAIQDRGEPFAACRLCFVEVEGWDEPVAACAETVQEGMVVHTRGEPALRLARTSAELLLASHVIDCGHCQKNRSCELQKVARHLGIKLKTNRLRKLETRLPIDDSSSAFICDPNKCVLCGRCVWVCRERLRIGAIGFTQRGFKRRVSTFGNEPLAESRCQGCLRCVEVCPVGALTFKSSRELEEDPVSPSEFE